MSKRKNLLSILLNFGLILQIFLIDNVNGGGGGGRSAGVGNPSSSSSVLKNVVERIEDFSDPAGGNWTKLLEAYKNESVELKSGNGSRIIIDGNEDLYRLIQKERFETESDGETDTEDDESSPSPPVTQRPQPLIIKSHPILSSSPISNKNGNNNNHKPPVSRKPADVTTAASAIQQPPPPPQQQQQPIIPTTTGKTPVMMMMTLTNSQNTPSKNLNQQLSASSSQLKSQLDDLFAKVTSFPHPTLIPQAVPGTEGFYQSFQYIKDAYFEVLEKLRDFRNTVSKRFEMIESQIQEATKMINKTITPPPPLAPQPIGIDNVPVQAMYLKMSEMERRYNMSRLVDHCVYFMLSNRLDEAHTLWTKIEMMTASNLAETNENLRDIVTLAYARNNSNTSPVFPFLRRLHGVEKTRLYDFLINGMKTADNFDGSEIFHIAQYLKERNAARSSIYSKIPKAVQYAVSGRNVNIVYSEKRARHYLHVRDDQNRKDRLNFYIQASNSYSDSRSAVWNIDFTSSSETFRIRNSLYGDYMYVNEEGFVETVPANTATHMGIEFNFILKKSTIMIQSKSYSNDPLVVIRGGGKFPFYFSLMRENPTARIAEFLVEPDTLL